MITVDHFLDHLSDDDSRQEIHSAFSEAERLTGHVFDLGNAEVRDANKMGDAIGLWETGPEKMAFRQDLFTPEGVGQATHVAVHEIFHSTGVLLEGFAEAAAAWLTHENPIAYHDEVRAAQGFFLVVGREESLELAREDNYQVALVSAYVQERVGSIGLEDAVKEATSLLKRCDVHH